ncbi:MAG: hypothetical protein EP329_28380 [Deltaproteobacteria bacterium]|nr:MAG: hypothetical protein EP329_28380 [Deltaproteobacteria bacterium]
MRVTLLAAVAAAMVACGGDGGSGGLTQVDGQTGLDAAQLCKGVDEPCDDEGARICTDDGVRECVEVGGCLEWGFPQTCAAGTRCADGECVPGCGDQPCTVFGTTKCDPLDATRFVRCDDYDGDGCLEWGGTEVCNAGTTCSAGSCVASCVDVCTAGYVKCEGSTVVTCDDADGDGCDSWGVPVECSGACALGTCVDDCRDTCGAEGLTTCDSGGVATCKRAADGCLHWGTAIPCVGGTTCSAGACTEVCSDECSAGATDCESGGVRTCGQFDADACREWSPPQPCGAGTSCSDGACTASCVSECTTDGARGCGWDGLVVRECGDWDDDPCLEWATVETCDAGETCSLGVCGTACVDECDTGESRCRPGSTTRIEVCGNADLDPCREWMDGPSCADSGEVCDGGACAATCQDDCQADVCSGGQLVPCGDFDDDACKDAGTPLTCEAWETCEGAACVARTPLAGLVISEVLYNAVGFDNDVFIELHGPAGASLVGYTLVALNGTTGDAYATIALTGWLDSAGYYVVAHPFADGAIADAADQITFDADLQNGPDNLHLRLGPAVVDALGYGHFGGGDHFLGEGAPAAGVDAGHSLARDAQHTDTNVNAVDFHDETVATPGAGPTDTVTPSAWHDLIITEIMPDPTSISDNEGEWFELYNPTGLTMRLEGCTVSDGGDDLHTFSAFDVPPHAWVSLARTDHPGFAPDYVYAGMRLTNSGDNLFLRCGQADIDSATWSSSEAGRAWQLDAGALAEAHPPTSAWCAATSVYNGQDRGTPGVENPPCATTGTYDQTLLDTNGGACTTSGEWKELTYTAVQPAVSDATLSFEWYVAWCATFGEPGRVWFQLRTGDTWTQVAEGTVSSSADACSWVFETGPIAKNTLNAARTASGQVHLRFSVQSGCALGILCGSITEPAPTNCARRVRLTYSH